MILAPKANRVKEVFRGRKETLEKREILVHRDRRVSLAQMEELPLKALIIGLQKTNRK